MKTIKHIILAVLVLFTAMSFVSCQKEPHQVDEPEIIDLDPGHTEELFRLAVENGYSLYSYTETGSHYHLVFHDVTVIESVKDKYPEGIKELDIPKGAVKRTELSTYALTVTFVSGGLDVMKRFGELLLSLPECLDTTAFIGHPLNIPFQIVSSNVNELEIYKAENDGCETGLELLDKGKANLILTPSKETGTAKVTLSNGLVYIDCKIRFDTYKLSVTDTPESFGEGEPFQFELPVETNLPFDELLVNSVSNATWVETSLNKVENEDGSEKYVLNVSLSQNETGEYRKTTVKLFEKNNFIYPVYIDITQPYYFISKPGCVQFKDRQFKRVMLEIADADGDGDISPEEALEVTELNIARRRIQDLSGLECFKNVWKLDAQDNNIEDGTVIKELPLLRWLDLKGNKTLKTFDVTTCTVFFEHCEFEITKDLIYYTTMQQYNVTNASDPWCEHSRHVRDDRQTTDWSRQDEIITVKKHTKGNGFPLVFTSFSLIDVDINDGSYVRFIMEKIDLMFNHRADKDFFDKWGDYLDIYIVLHLEPNRNRNDYDYECREKYRACKLELLEKEFYEKYYPVFARHPEEKYQVYFGLEELNPHSLYNGWQDWWCAYRDEMGILGKVTNYHCSHEEGESSYAGTFSNTRKMYYTETGFPIIAEVDKEIIVKFLSDPNY